jgi:pimeloyl-ACP methyl ester carboxylesterase
MTSQTLRANGLTFGYLEEGQGPLVLLIHGFPDTAHSWDATRPALAAAGFRAVSPFTRGYAPTEVPADADYRVETLAHDAAAIIEALGEQQAIVVGHDWGAATAFALANLHPERVRFLVTVAIPHPRSIKPSLGLLWKARHFLLFRLRSAEAGMRKNDFAMVDTLVRRWSPTWDVPPGETAAVKRAFAAPGCLEAALGYYRAASLKPSPATLGAITMPSLAFAGATDFAMKPPAYERARRQYKAAYEVVTLPGGHFLHREHPEQFNQALVARLKTLD